VGPFALDGMTRILTGPGDEPTRGALARLLVGPSPGRRRDVRVRELLGTAADPRTPEGRAALGHWCA